MNIPFAIVMPNGQFYNGRCFTVIVDRFHHYFFFFVLFRRSLKQNGTLKLKPFIADMLHLIIYTVIKYEYIKIYYRNAYSNRANIHEAAQFAWAYFATRSFYLCCIFSFFFPAASNRKISNTKIIELDDVASNNLMMKSTSFCHVNTR